MAASSEGVFASRHAGDRQAGLILPALGLVDRLDPVSLLTRLEIESLGPHLVVQRRERPDLLVARDDRDERRAHAAGAVAAEQVAGAKRISEEQLVVLRVERRRRRRWKSVLAAARESPS